MDADSQVAATLAMMADYARQDSQSLPIKSLAQSLVPQIYSAQSLCQVVFETVRKYLVFALDHDTAKAFKDSKLGFETDDFVSANLDLDSLVEVLIRPVDVVLMYDLKSSQVQGDCDDFSMLTSSLLLSLKSFGLPVDNVRFVTIAGSPADPTVFSHVYVKASINNQEVAFDCSHGEFAGWEASGATRYQEYPLESKGLLFWAALAGLLGVVILEHKSKPRFA